MCCGIGFLFCFNADDTIQKMRSSFLVCFDCVPVSIYTFDPFERRLTVEFGLVSKNQI